VVAAAEVAGVAAVVEVVDLGAVEVAVVAEVVVSGRVAPVRLRRLCR